jgi:hypothetical protein
MQASYRGKRRNLIGFLQRLPAMLAGRIPDETGGGIQALLTRLGLVALAIIRDAYVVKARGGADESGLKWPALSEKTIAYSRRHPGLKRDTAGTQRPSSALSADERATWWSLYRSRKAWYKGNKSHAAASAWTSLKAAGARTILMIYGQVQVEILRDTGRLLNSLAPGIKSPDQRFELGPGSVIVGTLVPYGKKHHEGDPESGLPQRRLWPDWSDWPDSWKNQIHEALQAGIADLVMRWLTQGKP